MRLTVTEKLGPHHIPVAHFKRDSSDFPVQPLPLSGLHHNNYLPTTFAVAVVNSSGVVQGKFYSHDIEFSQEASFYNIGEVMPYEHYPEDFSATTEQNLNPTITSGFVETRENSGRKYFVHSGKNPEEDYIEYSVRGRRVREKVITGPVFTRIDESINWGQYNKFEYKTSVASDGSLQVTLSPSFRGTPLIKIVNTSSGQMNVTVGGGTISVGPGLNPVFATKVMARQVVSNLKAIPGIDVKLLSNFDVPVDLVTTGSFTLGPTGSKTSELVIYSRFVYYRYRNNKKIDVDGFHINENWSPRLRRGIITTGFSLSNVQKDWVESNFGMRPTRADLMYNVGPDRVHGFRPEHYPFVGETETVSPIRYGKASLTLPKRLAPKPWLLPEEIDLICDSNIISGFVEDFSGDTIYLKEIDLSLFSTVQVSARFESDYYIYSGFQSTIKGGWDHLNFWFDSELEKNQGYGILCVPDVVFSNMDKTIVVRTVAPVRHEIVDETQINAWQAGIQAGERTVSKNELLVGLGNIPALPIAFISVRSPTLINNITWSEFSRGGGGLGNISRVEAENQYGLVVHNFTDQAHWNGLPFPVTNVIVVEAPRRDLVGASEQVRRVAPPGTLVIEGEPYELFNS